MRQTPPFQPQDQRNFILAVVLTAALVVAWTLFVEAPKRERLAQWKLQHDRQEKVEKVRQQAELEELGEDYSPSLTREQRLNHSPRVRIASEALSGSIALRGLRFDDLTLLNYKESIAKDSPDITLLSPSGDEAAYFAQIGWLNGGETQIALPDEHTLWKADRDTLSPGQAVHFTWDNPQGVRFRVTATLDANYMFTLTQAVENRSGAAVSVVPYGFINRAYDVKTPKVNFEGATALGVFDGSLTELTYANVQEKGNQRFEKASGWLGFGDKYWLTAFVPGEGFNAKFNYYQNRGKDRYQAEYAAPAITVAPGESAEYSTRLFAGVKVLKVLDAYADGDATHAPIPLFDRAVDFGWFYFLTKSLFKLLSALYHFTGNFGVAIIMLTLLVKTAMVPLAHKGYLAGCKMRILQPEFTRLRERHADDPLRLHKEMRALQKQENVSMGSLFFMLLIQIIMFLALNKVLFVSSEMRHAPFVWWIRDLSAADPANIFNLFGLIPIQMPGILHLGVLPIMMGLAMVLQSKMQTPPTDPIQAKTMKIMPYFFVFLFANMPSGVVLYSLFSSLFSIVHQWIVTRKFEHELKERGKRAALASS